MKVHFIAVGGSVMHNLAIALGLKGYLVSGSDDEIVEPAKNNLMRHGLLPEKTGWDDSRITPELDAVVLGMHAKADNPELKKAKALGIKIYSFPEFLFEQSKDKRRVVIGGSHGKTTITAMVLHILKKNNRDFDYMVGASLAGFDISVRLSENAPVMIFEGDEYPDSAINKIPKFHLYHPDIALLSGIAWDHINIFPTFEIYVSQFKTFVELIPPGGTLIFNSEDKVVSKIASSAKNSMNKIPYSTPEFEIVNGITYLLWKSKKTPLKIFGRHNLQNMMGAIEVCKTLGLTDEDCIAAIGDFTGASRRLELLGSNSRTSVFKDFAHSPSKLKATIAAVKEQFPERKLTACLELHTFSSLDKEFLNEYKGGMADADQKIVFCDSHTFELKGMKALEPSLIRKSFGDESIKVITEKNELDGFLRAQGWDYTNLLMMSSGNFGGLDLKELTTFVTTHL